LAASPFTGHAANLFAFTLARHQLAGAAPCPGCAVGLFGQGATVSAPKTFLADLAQNDRGEDNTVKLFHVMAAHPGIDREALGDSLLLKRPQCAASQ